MNDPQHIAVIDIGKTNAKLALVDLSDLREIAVITQPNIVRHGPPWPHFDVEAHWAFLLAGLKRFHQEHRVDAISVTTHGASVALLDGQGQLAAPILDYEHHFPPHIVADYDTLRPAFSETGSPSLVGGLNVGAQLHFQFASDPRLFARTAYILGYPQYWGHRLTGELAFDVTSIGCHTDLWAPQTGQFSSLVDRLHIAEKLAPIKKPSDILGSILPQIAAQTGLAETTPVVCGIHDSNASLYPHLLVSDAPFSVVSTGTWVIAMAIGGDQVSLDPARDTLINVNALGDAVPSARFMGGREFEMIQRDPVEVSQADVSDILAQNIMLMPAVEAGSGPFQGRKMAWIGPEPPVGSGQRHAALSYYLALMTGTCLDLAGATGTTIVEGPFARNAAYLDMLEAMTNRQVVASASATGTSVGAALLFSGSGHSIPTPQKQVSRQTSDLRAYAMAWQNNLTVRS